MHAEPLVGGRAATSAVAGAGGGFAVSLGGKQRLRPGPGQKAPLAQPVYASDESRAAVAGPRVPLEEDVLDPSARRAAQLAPPAAFVLAPPQIAVEPSNGPHGHLSLESLLPALVRRIAWGGDARRGSVRFELGAGSFAGASVVVHTDHGRVRVELTVPTGVDGEGWRRRIAARLAARGVDLEHVELI